MNVFGLTGGIGSGKSYIASLFEQLGIIVVDADIAARQVVEPCEPALKRIAERYKSAYPSILDANGQLNRGQLREIIFNQAAEKTWLEGLLHPLIYDCIVKQLKAAQSPYAILCSPLLLETNQKELCDKIMVVDITEQQQIERASKRDNNSVDMIKKIMQAQLSRAVRIEASDIIVNNQGSKEQTQEQVVALHSKLLKLCE